jgi:acyl dehydratase
MLVLAFLSETLTKTFGLSWFAGGKLEARFRAPVYPGDVITAEGTLQSAPDDGGSATYRVSCTNQSGVQVITGEATVPWHST